MKRMLSLCALLLLTASVSARAATSLNIGWSDCVGDGGTLDKTFACNTNSGSATLVLSFTPPAPIPQLSGAQAFVYLATSNGSAALPLWWSMFNAGTCRGNVLSANAVISDAAVNCLDTWSAEAGVAGISAYTMNWDGPGAALIEMVASVPPNELQSLDATSEWFLFNVKITYAATVGTSCTGCSSPATLIFRELDVSQPIGVGDFRLTTAGPRSLATWQGGFATPAQNKSWGMLKSLYR
ncbi:MAG TPA: hypothetical protein VMH61_08055 [Candidatus Acidoferrales bacterium]|nr:hypothetical protein [Candidatus Acidoferrales bacterium]